MKQVSIVVRADWDEEAQVWIATSSDVSGLVVESETLEALRSKVMSALCDLVQENGLEGLDTSLPDIPVHIMSQQVDRLSMPC